MIATKYDRFSTLPYLQLTGWSGADAFVLVLVLMAAYLGYAYLNAGLVSIEPLRRSKLLYEINLALALEYIRVF